MTEHAGAAGQTGKGGGGGFLIGLVVGIISGALVTAVVQPFLEAGPTGAAVSPSDGTSTPSTSGDSRDRDARSGEEALNEAAEAANDEAQGSEGATTSESDPPSVPAAQDEPGNPNS